jgi:trehalose/maltose hydrolase-like predicted phosphorylase
MRLDRILESEDDSVNRYQASKQADVLMLFYLFSSEEIQEHLQRMGYSFDHSAISRTIDYYHNRTSHGSTLSRLVFSWVLSRADRKRSWHLYEKALVSDFSDVQGGTTPEGIHLGAMAGTVDMMQRCYTGLEVRDDVLWLNPRLPENVDELRMRFRYRSHWIMLKICCDKMTVNVEEGWGNPIQIGVAGTVEEIRRKQTKTFALDMNYGPVNK